MRQWLKKISSSLIITFALPINSFAEYRVYQFYVKPRFKFVQDNNSYLITSALNPSSYIAYHGGSNSITVDLLRTWINFVCI